MSNAVKSISELITLNGKIQTDFSDVCTTMCQGGGAIMAIGRASGEHRVQQAVINALRSPLLYGNDISKATRILFNIYTSKEHQLYVDELQEIDAFMDELSPNIDVIWGMATDDTLDEDAKITILATGFDNSLPMESQPNMEDAYIEQMIDKLYGPQPVYKHVSILSQTKDDIVQEEEYIEPVDVTPLDHMVQTTDTEIEWTAQSEDTHEGENDTLSGKQPLSEEPPTPANTFLLRVLKRIKEGMQTMMEPDE